MLQSGGRLEEPVHDESLIGLPDGEAGADEPGVAAAQELGARVRLVAELGGDAQDLLAGLLGDVLEVLPRQTSPFPRRCASRTGPVRGSRGPSLDTD